MNCPAGLKPWRTTNGEDYPLFVPAAMLDESRERYRGMWVEPQPPELPTNRPITWADFSNGAA